MIVLRLVGLILILSLGFSGLLRAEMVVRHYVDENNLGVEMLQQGKYLEGLELLKRSYSADPYHPVLKENLLQGYVAAAEMLLTQQRYESAAELLLEAQEFDDTKREFWSLRGFALLRLKNYDEAETEFQEALGMGEVDAGLLYWLAEIYYNNDRMYDALDTLEDAFEQDPENHAIEQMLNKVRRELAVESEMEKEYGGNFVITFDGDWDDALGDDVLETLEDAYNWIGSQLDHYPDERVTVILYSRQQFKDLTNSPEWSGGLYDGKIRLPVGGVSGVNGKFKAILYHEYMHVVLQDITGGNLPVWLNEGLAQLAEAEWHPLDLEALQQARVEQRLLGLERLEQSFRGLDASQVKLAYRQSYSLVLFLVDEYGWHIIRDLLFALGEGQGFEQSFETVYGIFGLSYAGLFERWQNAE